MRAANKAQARKKQPAEGKGAAKQARRLAKKQAMPVVKAIEGPQEERIVHAELVHPAPKGGILEVLQQPYLLRLIVQRQLAAMYAASLLGLLWSYIQPAMRFLVYYLVFGFVFHQHAGFPSFAIHLFCGIVFVHYFSETWSGGTRSIWGNRALIQKMRMPREIFPVASMVVAGYHTFPQVVLLVIVCVVTGWHFSVASVLAGLLGAAILICFSLAMGLVFSALNVFFKDFQNIVQTLLQFTHFMVPMMYPFSRIATHMHQQPILYQLYMANPVAEAVLLMQRCFWWAVVPNSQKHGNHLVMQGQRQLQFPPDLWLRGLVMLVVCGALLMLAQKFFSRVEGKFAERM